MAPPDCKVPMNFGVQYLSCTSHCNIFFEPADGSCIGANSVIISLNSPVIHYLTTELAQEIIDVQEFSNEAVQCFLESCYSGDLKPNKNIFRHIIKMAHVFKVSWMNRKLNNYFRELVNVVDVETTFDDLLFLFEESVYVNTAIKNGTLMDSVVKKFSSELIKSDQFFVCQFLVSLPLRSNSSSFIPGLDAIVKITKNHTQVIINAVSGLIQKKDVALVEESCYLLERIDTSSLQFDDSKAYIELLERICALENLPITSFKKINAMLINNAKKSFHRISQDLSSKSLPNCKFLEFKSIKDFEDSNALLDYLCTCSDVTNGYIMYDALHEWAVNKVGSKLANKEISCFKKFGEVLQEKHWTKIAENYMDKTNDSKREDLRNVLQPSCNRIESQKAFTLQELFENNNDVKFYFHHPKREKCGQTCRCGFIVQVTGLFPGGILPAPFSIRFISDHDFSSDDINLNMDCIDASNMHIAMKIIDEQGESEEFPITWLGYPYKEETGKYFVWGRHRFFVKGQGVIPKEKAIYDWCRYYLPESKIVLVVYVFE